MEKILDKVSRNIFNIEEVNMEMEMLNDVVQLVINEFSHNIPDTKNPVSCAIFADRANLYRNFLCFISTTLENHIQKTQDAIDAALQSMREEKTVRAAKEKENVQSR